MDSSGYAAGRHQQQHQHEHQQPPSAAASSSSSGGSVAASFMTLEQKIEAMELDVKRACSLCFVCRYM
jgi:hypothetical protein